MSLPRHASAFTGSDSVGNTNGPWDDIQGRITLGDAVANPTYEAYRDTPWKTWFMRHDQDDELHLSLQMSHSWDPTTAVRFHIHMIPMADPLTAQNIRFTGYYSWAGFGVETPALSGWTPFTADKIVSPGDVYKEMFVQCFEADPPGSLESSILLIYLKRDSGTADSYTTSKDHGTPQANVCILAVDAHYQKDKEGTATEIPA